MMAEIAGLTAETRTMTAEIDRLEVQLEGKLSESDTGVVGSISSVPSPMEASNIASAGHTITDVLPFDDDRVARVDIASATAGVAGGGARVSSLEFLQSRMGLSDFAHDGAWRDAMVDEMRKGGQSYSDDEVDLLADAKKLLDNFA
jgi:hypothetical protein